MDAAGPAAKGRRATLLVLLFASALACASGGRGSEPPTSAESPSPPPPGSPMARVESGMTDAQVRSILGAPDEVRTYVTGKNFIPFYYGGDTSRSDWIYQGQGRVVFSRNRWSGGLNVVNVIYQPDEPR